uniref:Uncharacterized protein n=1 Tax=Anguilla anguilla TaxID=7936 RepID=A0A0E9PQC2_ANGAN
MASIPTSFASSHQVLHLQHLSVHTKVKPDQFSDFLNHKIECLMVKFKTFYLNI